MGNDWLESVLHPQLARVVGLLETADPKGWDAGPLRALIADIVDQLRAAAGDGTLTDEQVAHAAKAVGDTLRSHPRVTTEEQFIYRSRRATFSQPLADIESNPRLLSVLIDRVLDAVAAGRMSAETAADIIARLRGTYGPAET